MLFLHQLFFAFPSGVGECEIDPSIINPLNFRRPTTDAFTGPEVDLEKETPDYEAPEETPDTGDGVSVTGTKITKTTTTKKVTVSTSKKTTSKTSEKEYSSTKGSSSASSSSSSFSSSSSQSGYDNVEGSGDGDGNRVHGRTHSRVSRRIYSSSERSRFNENELGGKTGEGEEDEDGRVITHYERTHHSSGTSPDGTTTFKETRHESKKVTVSEDTNTEHIPRGRWGQGGGYKHTHTSSRSSSSSFDGEPEETRTRWETHRTYSAGRDGDDQLGGSDSSDLYGRREESHRQHSKTHTYSSSSGGSHSDGLEEDNYHRVHEGGAVTQTIGGDGTYYTESDRRTRTRVQGSTDDRDRFVWSDQNEGTPEDRDSEGHYYRQSTRTSRVSESRSSSGGESYRDSDGDRSGRREESRNQWSHTRYEDRPTSQGHDDELRRNQDYSSHGDHDRYSSGQGYRGHDEETRTYSQSWQSEGTGRGASKGDRWGDQQYRSQQDGSRRDEYTRSHATSDAGMGRSHTGNYGGYEDSHIDSQSHRSHSEARTSSWHSHSTTGHENRGGFDVNSHHGKGKTSSHHFAHVESGDGTIQNGTYTRVEVDPETGETKTYTSKVVYNKWPTDHDLLMAQRDATGEEEDMFSDYHRSNRRKREQELIIKPQAVTDEKTGKTMQVVHLVSNIQVVVAMA